MDATLDDVMRCRRPLDQRQRFAGVLLVISSALFGSLAFLKALTRSPVTRAPNGDEIACRTCERWKRCLDRELWSLKLQDSCRPLWIEFMRDQPTSRDFISHGGIRASDIDLSPNRFPAARSYFRGEVTADGHLERIVRVNTTGMIRPKDFREGCFRQRLVQAARVAPLPHMELYMLFSDDTQYKAMRRCKTDSFSWDEWRSVRSPYRDWLALNSARPNVSELVARSPVLTNVGSFFDPGFPILDGSLRSGCDSNYDDFLHHPWRINASDPQFSVKWRRRISRPFFFGSPSSKMRKELLEELEQLSDPLELDLTRNITLGTTHIPRENYVMGMLSFKYLVDFSGMGPWSRRIEDAVAAGGVILQDIRAYSHFQRFGPCRTQKSRRLYLE